MSNQDQFSGNSEGLFVENLHKKKAKIETECEETDRISKLPYAIIVQILSLLSITDAFRKTVLSKDWQYFWTCINNIAYDNEEYGRLDNSTLHKFISLTENALPLLISCSTIKKLSLNFVFRYNDVEDLRLNIRHRTIYLILHDQPYSLPEVLCSSSSIIKLNCEKCRILEDCVLNWTSLKSLTLESLFLRDEHIKQIISNCPQLESLKIHKFCGFTRLHMTSPKCRRLQLIHHSHSHGDWYPFKDDTDTCCFEIIAPYVEHLTISRGFNYTKIKLRDLSSLNHANLNLYCDEFAERDENIVKDFFGKLLKERKHLSFEENIFKVSLQNLKNVKVMPLCSQTDTSDHAINLEKLAIVSEHKECNSCSTDTSNLKKNLLAFPTTSISAIISLGNAFRTTILYKHWQYFWTSIDVVYDNEELSRSDSSMVHKFISLTDNVLPLLSISSIKKCSLNFVFKHEDHVSYFSLIDKWLEFAVNKKMEGLCLNISYDIDAIEHDQPYSLPEVFCSSSSILKLKCQNCKILDNCVLNWTSLKSLMLGSLLIPNEHIKQIMSNCPQLESFNLYGFCGFNRLHMTSPKCKRLKLIDHYHPIGDWYSFEGDCCFELLLHMLNI
ncbi:hypothetical protein H5410_005302 [Solanum commersonii]|uniref:F-box domain-containing protein n=1 Tax=Solanum commersonii TaxID=4109 RepID=A0A9J6A773_SOLCO|nr:hypothetical protein H5410_005302 [Solanum commersonii]